MRGRHIAAVVRKDLKKTIREPAALFIILLFPFVLTLIFGVSFGGIGGDQNVAYKVGVVDLNAAGPAYHWSADFVANLSESGLLNVQAAADNATAQADLSVGNLQAVLVIPADFGLSCDSFLTNPTNASAWTNTTLGLYLDRGSLVATQAIPPIVSQALAQTLAGGQTVTQTLPVTLGTASLVAVAKKTAFDFMVPGLFAYGAIFLTMTVGASFTVEREEGLLRRIQTTPLTSSEFMVAQVASNMILAVAQVGIVFGSAFLIGYRPDAGLLGLAMAFVLVSVFSLACVGFGLITATLARSSGAATGIAFLFVLPQMFLGTFVTAAAPTAFSQAAGQFVPAYYVTDALTNLFLRGADPAAASILLDLGIVAAIGVLVLLLGIVLFRQYGRR